METHFTVEVSVGTPAQKFELVADTGSDAIIVQSCICREFTPECKEAEDCFMGTNKSSSFVAPAPNKSLRLLSFGSGDIVAAIATDIVVVGQAKATMKKGLLLMVNRALNMAGHFEGILGLGVPSWVEAADTPPMVVGTEHLDYKADSDRLKKQLNGTEQVAPMPRFMEQAGVEKFSICMNDNGRSGVMRMQPPDAPKMLKQVGHRHWALDFQGISVGSEHEPVTICDKANMDPTQAIACAGIPDSGTTLMMGPREQVDRIFADVCNRWPRCVDNQVGADPRPESAFRTLLWGCEDWIDQGGGLAEIPSLFVHVGGTDGERQTLELTAWSYIISTTDDTGYRTCEALFGSWDYHTALHGPVWIFGTPLFYEFQVVFSATRPATIGFSKAECGSCGEEGPAHYNPPNGTGSFGQSRRIPRLMRGAPRMPSIDRTQPL